MTFYLTSIDTCSLSAYMTSYSTSMDTISLSCTVLEKIPVKILKATQMAEFDLMKIQVKNRFFSIIQKAPPLTKTASFEILRIKIGSAV